MRERKVKISKNAFKYAFMPNVLALQFIVIGVNNGFWADSKTAADGDFMADMTRLMPTNLVSNGRDNMQCHIKPVL
jgi:hypothetical protein